MSPHAQPEKSASAPALGVDIGGSSIKLALILPRLNQPILIQSDRYSNPDAGVFEHVLSDLAQRPTLASAIAAHPPRTVGVCLPGVWNDTTCSLERSNNLPKLVGVPLRSLLDRAMGRILPTWTLSTDVHATAIDLWHQLAQSIPTNSDNRPRRLFCLALGTGVGACVLDEGTLLRVNGNSSGHFGQIDVTVADVQLTPIAADGGSGTLEAYWAAANVQHCLSKHIGPGLPPMLLQSLARALRIAHAIYRPDGIVLAGGTSLSLAPHLDEIEATTRQGLSAIARPHCGIHLATHAHHAALGIARLAAAQHPVQ